MQGNVSRKITDLDGLLEYQNQLVANEANIRKTADEKLEEKINNFQRNEFSGSYNDLIDKPVIYDKLADLKDDDLHRTVSDEEKASWDAKSDFSGSYNDLVDKPDIPSIEGLASKIYVNEKVSEITEMSPDTIEAIDKLSGMIESDPEFVINMGNKADSDLSNVSNENFKNKIEESGYAIEIPEASKESIGLGNVDNTADIDKPVSAAQQAALNNKADTNLSNVSNENFKNKIEESGYAIEIPEASKESIGLGNVDNTADIDKPVSAAQRAVLNDKADKNLSNVDNEDFKNKIEESGYAIEIPDHASTTAEYGIATSSKYGHLKLADNLNTNSAAGIALSAKQGKILNEKIDGLYSFGTEDLVAGESALETGKLYFVYE